MSHTILWGSVLLGFLSVPVCFFKKPRFFWGSAGFDPISFFWMISFLLYGPFAALLSSLIGSFGLSLFSKEPTPLLGAALKFTGTLTVWITFYFILFISPNMFCSTLYLEEPSIYMPLSLLAALFRCIVLIPVSFFAIPYFLSLAQKKPVSYHVMIEEFGGMFNFFFSMIGVNFWITFLDTLIPWLLVFPTGIHARFAVW